MANHTSSDAWPDTSPPPQQLWQWLSHLTSLASELELSTIQKFSGVHQLSEEGSASPTLLS